jgi:hypothetical protein
MQVRAEGRDVRFILVQNSERCNLPGFATIADLAKERLRRACRNISKKSPPGRDVSFRIVTIE